MRNIFIFVLVIAVAIMVLGLANIDGRTDIGYFFGTWSDVSLLAVFAVVAGLAILVGIGAAGFAALHTKRDRHKLELELQQIYVRLRTAEAAVPAGPDVAPSVSVDVAPSISADAACSVGVDDAPGVPTASEPPRPDDVLDAEAAPGPADEAARSAVADGDPVDPAVG